MGVYIKGMKMPEDDCTAFRSVTVWNQWVDGEIKIYAHNFYTNEFIGEVINVPPHGRLVDADALLASDLGGEPFKSVIRRVLMQAPTVIEGERSN